MFDKNEVSSMKVERLYREIRDFDNQWFAFSKR